MEFRLKYQLLDPSTGVLADAEGRALLEEDAMSLTSSSAAPLLVPYSDMLEMTTGDFEVAIRLEGGEELRLYHLGRGFGDFCTNLARLRNDRLITDLLMRESVKRPGIQVQLGLTEPGAPERRCRGEFRLYETAVVVIPEGGDPVRVPLSDVLQIRREDHTLRLEDEAGKSVELSQMGREFQPTADALDEAMSALSLQIQTVLKDLAPEQPPSAIWRAAALMKEGKAARREDLDREAPGLWTDLEARLSLVGIGEEYASLKSLSHPPHMAIGVKRGLMGDLTGEYVWFLAPLYGGGGRPGNAVAMEAASGEDAGRATYFFRMIGRGAYPASTEEELHREMAELMPRINRALLAVNFRREPIYLPDEKLREPRFSRYRLAARKIPELQLLRERFIGRVAHRSPEQWQADVIDLLEFNVRATDDGERWSRGTVGD